MKTPFLIGERIYLRPVFEDDLDERYLTWLNDPDVNVYSSRRAFPSSPKDMHQFLDSVSNHEYVLLAIVGKESDNYVGNILLGAIDWVNRSAQISIMIGDKTAWGKGYATEAIAMLTEHAFKNLNLHRVFSGTINPGFKKIVCEKLGWNLDGEQKRAIWCDGRYIDVWIMSKLNE